MKKLILLVVLLTSVITVSAEPLRLESGATWVVADSSEVRVEAFLLSVKRLKGDTLKIGNNTGKNLRGFFAQIGYTVSWKKKFTKPDGCRWVMREFIKPIENPNVPDGYQPLEGATFAALVNDEITDTILFATNDGQEWAEDSKIRYRRTLELLLIDQNKVIQEVIPVGREEFTLMPRKGIGYISLL